MSERANGHGPVLEHSVPVNSRNWLRYSVSCEQAVSRLLNTVVERHCGGAGEAARDLRRLDVVENCKSDLHLGIVAAIVWGYPKGKLPGGRGFQPLFSRLTEIAEEIAELKNKPPRPASEICERMSRFPRLGPSTYTKLLYFAGVLAEEGRCLIYDQMVMRSIGSTDLAAWSELKQRLGSAYRPDGRYRMYSAKQQEVTYGAYLTIAERVAGSPELADRIELDLFASAPKGRRGNARPQ